METWTNDRGEKVELTKGEAFILQWQRGMLGHFSTLLADAMDCADWENRLNLARGFPEEAEAVVEWKEGDMHARLREKGFSL